MSNNILVSVIIPAYNAGAFIKQSLNSVLNQTHKNIEVIIIDDGSTDDTASICQAYTEKHGNIKYFFQKNAGVSSARNKGILLSSGSYLCFLDSDDTYDGDFISTLINQQLSDNSDFSYCLFRKIHFDKKITLSTNYNTSDNTITNFLNFNYFDICCLMLKKDFLVNNHICFDETMVVGEDVLFILKCLSNGTYSYINKYLYSYIYQSNSLMNKKWRKKDYLNDIDAWKKILSEFDDFYNKNDKIFIMKK